MICCGLVDHATKTSPQQVRRKLAASHLPRLLGSYGEMCVMDYGNYTARYSHTEHTRHSRSHDRRKYCIIAL